MNHKYSSSAIVFLILPLIGMGILASAIDGSELDGICSTDNKLLKRLNGTWVCADDLTSYVNGTNDTNETSRINNMIITCPAGDYVNEILVNGTTVCTTPSGSIDTNETTRFNNLVDSCAGGNYVNQVNSDGSFSCSTPTDTSCAIAGSCAAVLYDSETGSWDKDFSDDFTYAANFDQYLNTTSSVIFDIANISTAINIESAAKLCWRRNASYHCVSCSYHNGTHLVHNNNETNGLCN